MYKFGTVVGDTENRSHGILEVHMQRESIKMFYGYGFGKPCSLMNSHIHVHEKGRLNQFDSVPRILSQIQDLLEYLHIYYE